MADMVREVVTTQETVTPMAREATSTQTVANLIYFLFGILEALLAFRFIFKLAGASLSSAFVQYTAHLHITMSGTAFGIKLYLDEVITVYEPPLKKEWETVGDLRILVIGHYRLGFNITQSENSCIIRVFIDYELPQRFIEKILSFIFGRMYAKWCVTNMTKGIQTHFGKNL